MQVFAIFARNAVIWPARIPNSRFRGGTYCACPIFRRSIFVSFTTAAHQATPLTALFIHNALFECVHQGGFPTALAKHAFKRVFGARKISRT
jgi:hypothetical protein